MSITETSITNAPHPLAADLKDLDTYEEKHYLSIIMRILHLFLFTAVILASATCSSAAPERLADLKAIYDAEVVKIAELNVADIASIKKSYLNYLDAELKKNINSGDFKTYEKIELEKKRFEQEMTIPEDSPLQKSLAQAEIKRIALINDLSIRYVPALKAHQVSLMKAQAMDAAREVQQEIDIIQALIAEYTAKLPVAAPTKNIGADATTSPGKVNLTKPAAITVSRKNTELLVGNSAYDNYQYLLTEVPKELAGYFFTQQTKRQEVAVEFEVTVAGIVYCFSHNPPDAEWKATGGTVGINYNGNVAKLKVFNKPLIKGIYNLAQGAWLIFPTTK